MALHAWPMTRRTISSIACWLGLAFLLACALPMLWSASGGGAILSAILFSCWIAAPVFGMAALASASPSPRGAAAFLGLELALIAWTVRAVLQANLHGNSTAFAGVVLLPVLQWPGVLLAFLLALACGWRMRPDFLKD